MNEDDPPAIGKMLLAGLAALAMLVLLFFAVKASAQGEHPGVTILATICLGASACRDVPVSNSLLDNRVTMTSCQMDAPALAQWMTKNWPGYRFAGWKCVIGNRRVDL